MRIIAAASLVFTLALASAAGQGASRNENDERPFGQAVFRFDTFGDEQLWTGVLRMHEVIRSVPPATALAVGPKVDVEAPASMIPATMPSTA